MNITILIIAFILLLEHATIFYVDEANNIFTVLGLIIITILIAFNVFGLITWLIILGLGIGLFIVTFIEEYSRFKSYKQEKDQGTSQLM